LNLVSKHRDRPDRAGWSPRWIKVKNPKSPAMHRAKDAFSWSVRPRIGSFGSRNTWPRWHIVRRSLQPSARPSSCWSWPSVSAARL